MSDETGPTLGEVTRRQDAFEKRIEKRIDEGFSGVNQRLDGLPSESTLLALLQGRDAANAAEFRSLRDDVKDLGDRLTKTEADMKIEVEKVRNDSRAEVARLEERLSKSRTAVIAVGGVLTSGFLGVLAIVFGQLGGTP